MKTNWLYKNILEPLFFRWKIEVSEIRNEEWQRKIDGVQRILSDPQTEEYKRGYTTFYKQYVIYTYTNKFDGSVKIKKVYI